MPTLIVEQLVNSAIHSLRPPAIAVRDGQEVSELRIDFGPGYRVCYGADGEELVILLVGGMKMRQARDIATPQACWRAYQQEKRKCQ